MRPSMRGSSSPAVKLVCVRKALGHAEARLDQGEVLDLGRRVLLAVDQLREPELVVGERDQALGAGGVLGQRQAELGRQPGHQRRTK